MSHTDMTETKQRKRMRAGNCPSGGADGLRGVRVRARAGEQHEVRAVRPAPAGRRAAPRVGGGTTGTEQKGPE